MNEIGLNIENNSSYKMKIAFLTVLCEMIPLFKRAHYMRVH